MTGETPQGGQRWGRGIEYIAVSDPRVEAIIKHEVEKAVAAERERCAKIVEAYADSFNEGPHAKAWMRDAASCIRKGE
jgi:hypothetical protein